MKKQNAWANCALKTAAFLLAVLSFASFLLFGAASVGGLFLGAYDQKKEEFTDACLESAVNRIAMDVANVCAAERNGGYWYNAYFSRLYTEDRFDTCCRYSVSWKTSGAVVKETYKGEPVLYSRECLIFPGYIGVKTFYTAQGDTYEGEYFHELETPWVVTVYIVEQEDAGDPLWLMYQGSQWLYGNKGTALTLTVLSLILCILCTVYLFCAAGRRPGREGYTPGFWAKVPLELYPAGLIVLGAFLYASVEGMCNYLEWEGLNALATAGVIGCGLLALLTLSLLFAFLLTIGLRLKLKGGYIWRRTLVFGVLSLPWRIMPWLLRGVKRCLGRLGELFRLLPLMGQWLLISLGLTLLLLIAVLSYNAFLLVVAILLWLLLTVYYAWSFAMIRKGIGQIARGDLNCRMEEKKLFGNFRVMAQELNEVSAGTEAEVERRMRSERMKTELITNVSHDIKTPLTSIVSYVDLLQKPHTPEEEAQYLEVLARQSQRLKKLTEDLVEMSKAASGSISVKLGKTGIVELINQAVGEYEEKMESVRLNLVKKLPEVEIYAMADGKLLWRVLDNLLGNTVKYAMPGTRVYLEAAGAGDTLTISIKNISGEPLELSAEELMERFVRGDKSRNTEGSGLGLNIADSLMKLQGGRLLAESDGDLFKVTLTLRTFH